MKKDAIKENNCLIQLSPFGVCNFFSVLAMPLMIRAKDMSMCIRERESEVKNKMSRNM